MNAADQKVLDLSFSQFDHVFKQHQHNAIGSLTDFVTAILPAPPSPAAPSGTDLTNILNSIATAPGTTSIATVPNTVTTMEYQLLAQVQTLDSYIAILTAFCIYNEHPAPYDITDKVQASAFTKAQAKWRNYVVTGGTVKALAGYVPVSAITPGSMSKTVVSADLHLEFLTELFGGFGFTAATLTELDSILTQVASALRNLSLSFSSATETLDHFLSYYYFDTVAGTGGTGQPPAIYQVKIRVFYLQINQSSWNATVGKSSVQKFSFDMNYYDMETTMSSALVATDMATINASIKTLTGQDDKTINKLMKMQAVHADPK